MLQRCNTTILYYTLSQKSVHSRPENILKSLGQEKLVKSNCKSISQKRNLNIFSKNSVLYCELNNKNVHDNIK